MARSLSVTTSRWLACGLVVSACINAGCSGTNNGGDSGVPDSGADAGSDAGVADGGTAGLLCGKLLLCDQACSVDGCTDGCYSEATGVAQGLFNSLTDCIDGACPATDGGPCATDGMACSACNTRAATGPCVSRLLEGVRGRQIRWACEHTDGGAVIPDAGMFAVYNCGGLIECLSVCTADAGSCTSSCVSQSTAEAVVLSNALDTCLAGVCPSTDGGPCEVPGVACNGCIVQAEFSLPYPCGPAYNACETDTSNSSDAGYAPVVLNGGTFTTLEKGDDQIGSALFVRGTTLFYATENNSNYLTSLNLVDGGIARIGPPQTTPVGLAIDSNNAYAWNYGSFTTTANVSNADGIVSQIPLDGGAPLMLSSSNEVYYSAPYLTSISVDATTVYWVTGALGHDGAIMHTAIGNTNATPLYSNQSLPEAVVSDGTHVFWATWGTFDNQGSSNNDGQLFQGDVDGGAPMVLASNLSAPASIVHDAANVYWTNLGRLGGNNLPALNSGSVMMVPIGGGTVTTIADQQAVPVSLAVSNGVVYWTEYGLNSPGLLMSAPTDGGVVVPLMSGLLDPYGVTLSGNTLYFTSYWSRWAHRRYYCSALTIP